MQLMLHLLMDSLASGCSLLKLFLILTIFFQPLEDCIRDIFIPAVTGHLPPGDIERDLLALPTQVGGMSIITIKMCSFEFSTSEKVTMPLQSLLLSQINANPISVHDAQFSIKSDILQAKFSKISSTRHILIDSANVTLKRSIELASEKGGLLYFLWKSITSPCIKLLFL